jgi:hypothetical protein
MKWKSLLQNKSLLNFLQIALYSIDFLLIVSLDDFSVFLSADYLPKFSFENCISNFFENVEM